MLPRISLSRSPFDRSSDESVAAELFPAAAKFESVALVSSRAVREKPKTTKAPRTRPATKIPIARCTDHSVSVRGGPGHFFRGPRPPAPAAQRLHPCPGKGEPGKTDRNRPDHIGKVMRAEINSADSD